MGNGQTTLETPFHQKTGISNPSLPTPSNQVRKLKKLSIIGRGGFGKVWKVQTRKGHHLYAMKQMSKAKILIKKNVQSIMNELGLLMSLKHDFIINAQMAFEDRDNLYLLMDLLEGGDLRYHLLSQPSISEQTTKFIMGCVVLALQFLHNNCVMHRDLKPENIVLESSGYARVTDLGVARIWRPHNRKQTSGTLGYMAPEVLCQQNHGVACDYFALGVIVYECMLGCRPYAGQTRHEMREHVLRNQVRIEVDARPAGWSIEAVDFINRCLERNPSRRLGFGGPVEAKTHPWFHDIDWELLRSKQLQPPFKPTYKVEEYEHQLAGLVDGPLPADAMLMLRRLAAKNIFAQYYYEGGVPKNPLLQPIKY